MTQIEEAFFMSSKVHSLQVRKNGYYYFRLRIPLDLTCYFPKAELRVSLKTKNKKKAKIISISYSYKINKLFTLIRCGMLTQEQIISLSEELFHDFLSKDENNRALNERKVTRNEETGYADDLSWLVSDFMEELDLDLRSGRSKHIEKYFQSFLKEKDINIDVNSDEYKLLAREAGKRLMKAYSVIMEREQGNYDNDYDKHQRNRIIINSSPKVKQHQVPDVQEDSEPLIEMIEKYKADRIRGKHWATKSAKQFEGYFEVLIELLGNVSIKSITHHDLLDVKEKLFKIPPHRKTDKKYKHLSLKEIFKLPSIEKALSPTSINQHLTIFSSFFKWCAKHEYIHRNIGEGLGISVNNQDNKEPFTIEELQMIFDALPSKNGKRPERFWIPIIALYTGMRRGEICQLYVEDVTLVDDILCFNVNEYEDKNVKTASGKRIVPIHSVLIDLGFLDYVKECKNRNDERLWMKLKPDKNGDYGKIFGNWFSGFKNKLDLTDKEKKTFHSFRHNFTDCLKQLLVQETLIAELAGHKIDSIDMNRYGKRYRPDVLKPVVEKLDYSLKVKRSQAS